MNVTATKVEEIETYILRNDGISFATLGRMFGRGDLEIYLEKPNIVLWQGMSDEVFEVIRDLLQAGKIWIKPCDEFVYMIDGGFLKIPVAKRTPRGGAYKTKRWLPVVIMTGPIDEKKAIANPWGEIETTQAG